MRTKRLRVLLRTQWSFDPAIDIVGLPDAAVNESRQRVYSAIENAGLSYPRLRIVVNLAPAVASAGTLVVDELSLMATCAGRG